MAGGASPARRGPAGAQGRKGKTTGVVKHKGKGSAKGKSSAAATANAQATTRLKLPVKRTEAREEAYIKTQQAVLAAQELLASSPPLASFRPGRLEAAKRCSELLAMSLGRHHGRTPVPELRAGVAGLRAWARQRMAGDAATWVGHVLEALEGHLGAVNTDKSWQPFVETIAFQVRMSAFLETR